MSMFSVVVLTLVLVSGCFANTTTPVPTCKVDPTAYTEGAKVGIVCSLAKAKVITVKKGGQTLTTDNSDLTQDGAKTTLNIAKYEDKTNGGDYTATATIGEQGESAPVTVTLKLPECTVKPATFNKGDTVEMVCTLKQAKSFEIKKGATVITGKSEHLAADGASVTMTIDKYDEKTNGGEYTISATSAGDDKPSTTAHLKSSAVQMVTSIMLLSLCVIASHVTSLF